MTPEVIKEIKEAAHRYMKQYDGELLNNGISGIGVGNNCINVYLHNSNNIEKLPTSFEEFVVKIIIVGDIIAL